jgi:hypothetical protein
MESNFYIIIAALAIPMVEYLLLDFYLIYSVRSRYSQGIKINFSECLFLSMATILMMVRVLIAVITPLEDIHILGILYCVSYLSVFCLYSIFTYTWYYLNRVSIYLLNTFHISQSTKENLLTGARWGLIILNVTMVVSIMIIIICDPNSFSNLGDDNIQLNPSLAVRIHQITSTSILYIILITVGGTLLRQIKKYYTETPYYLVISKYAILGSYTFALIVVGLQMTVEQMYNPVVL